MEGYKELLEKLNRLVTALENGDLSLEELNELESVTRQLHERSIILRYKAFEKDVLGEKEEADVLASEPEPQPEEPEPDVAPVIEVEEEKEDEPAFDFAIFDDAEEDDSEVIEEETVEAVVEQEAEVQEKEEPAPEPEPEKVETIEPVEMEEKETESIDPVDLPDPAPTPAPTTTGNPFLDKFAHKDNSVAGRFSESPISTLIGAFGLNERLRFINDLFDGSSEKFSDAIKALDSQANIDAAREKAAGYAEENEWDPEEEVVVEFMHYLNRRYA